MKGLSGLVVLLGVCLSLSCIGCSKQDRPMPLTKQNSALYLQKMAEATRGIDPGEVEAAKGDEKKKKELFHKAFIAPMETMGYSYDRTMADLSGKVLTKTLITSDSAMTIMLSDILTFAKNSREASYQYGFISQETKGLLDQVSLILPR